MTVRTVRIMIPALNEKQREALDLYLHLCEKGFTGSIEFHFAGGVPQMREMREKGRFGGR